MGTHPIFESDFDSNRSISMIARALLSRGLRRAPVLQKRTNIVTSLVSNFKADGPGTFWADAYIVGIWAIWASYGCPFQMFGFYVGYPGGPNFTFWFGAPVKTEYQQKEVFDYKGCKQAPDLFSALQFPGL